MFCCLYLFAFSFGVLILCMLPGLVWIDWLLVGVLTVWLRCVLGAFGGQFAFCCLFSNDLVFSSLVLVCELVGLF